MATAVAAMSGVPLALQSAATSGNGIIVAPPPSFGRHTITIIGNGTVSTGAIQIETSNDPNYAGTWAQIGGGPIAILSGAVVVYNFDGIFQFIQARISTNVTGAGGSVTVNYEGSKSY